MTKKADGEDQKGQNQNSNQPGENSNDGNGSADVSKTIEGLKADLETLKRKHDDSEKWIQDTSIVLSAIGSDPAVKKSVQDSIIKMYGPTSPPDPANPPVNPIPAPPENPPVTPANPPVTPPINPNSVPPANPPVTPTVATTPPVNNQRLEDLESSGRNTIIEKFYKDTGLNNLDEDKRQAISRKIETQLNKWGQGVKRSDLLQLPQLLKDAFVLSGKQELSKEDLAKTQTNQGAMIPNINGAGITPPQDGEVKLTEEQSKLAKMWGLDEGRIKKRILESKTPGAGQLGENTLEPVKKAE